MERNKAVLLTVNIGRKVYNWYCNGTYFIIDKVRLAGYIKHSDGHLIERVTGSNYIQYGIRYIENL